ncbi:small ribosomal subunit biogenesis GTPase RsgA [Isoalcanivorax beigongshangi]|uniref:Small ribosomal subunit biogenesis GTPase RsgA n=1 Tax=Isoalcanivorax beigongshangi TaxID=3238810 RepID=A0ABV4AGW2_9GAMM
MSKRQLNRRQRWRIDKIQNERLERARRRQQRLDSDVADELGDTEAGRVTAHYGSKVEVEAQARPGERLRCHFRATLPQLVVGDLVFFQPPRSAGDGVVVALEPRRTELRRPDFYGNLKPVAANLDRLLIVFAPLPVPSSQLLDRYLVAAELSGIAPVLVLNKADLVDDVLRPYMDELCKLYTDLDYPVIEASATEATGLDALRAALTGHCAAFVGQSGVGKSSLVNALLPEAALAIGALSERSGLGQHTTTTAQLFDVPGGGVLIDSPGIREFGLWHIDEPTLLSGYTDLAPLAGRCRFRNCSHRHEPGCALHQAVADGRVAEERLDNFFRIAETLDDDTRARYTPA